MSYSRAISEPRVGIYLSLKRQYILLSSDTINGPSDPRSSYLAVRCISAHYDVSAIAAAVILVRPVMRELFAILPYLT